MSEHMSDSQFGKIFALMTGGMVILTVVLIIIAHVVVGSASARTSDVQRNAANKAMAERIQPVGRMRVGEIPAAPAIQVAVSSSEQVTPGENVYNNACAACHGTGAAGAPKFGDMAAWEPRVAQGKETLYMHAINGVKAMPPKGGNTALTDTEVKAAVDHILARLN